MEIRLRKISLSIVNIDIIYFIIGNYNINLETDLGSTLKSIKRYIEIESWSFSKSFKCFKISSFYEEKNALKVDFIK